MCGCKRGFDGSVSLCPQHLEIAKKNNAILPGVRFSNAVEYTGVEGICTDTFFNFGTGLWETRYVKCPGAQTPGAAPKHKNNGYKFSNLTDTQQQEIVQYTGTAGSWLTQGSAALANLFHTSPPPAPTMPSNNTITPLPPAQPMSTNSIALIVVGVVVIGVVIYFVSKKKK